MTNVKTFISGCYPRSEALVQATRDHDRKRIDDAELNRVRKADREALINAQLQNNFDYYSDGLLDWQDDFRPVVSAAGGVRTGALKRYFNTNTFYRQPVFEMPSRVDTFDLQSYFHTDASKDIPYKSSLPGPASFQAMSVGSNNSLDEIVGLLKQIIFWLIENNCFYIQLREPWLAYHSHRHTDEAMNAYVKSIKQLVSEVRSKNPKVQIGVHLPFGDAAPLLKALDAIDFDFMGVDFYETDLDQLRVINWKDKELVAGCINGRNSLIEQESVIADFIAKAMTELSPNALSVTNNVGMGFIPQSVAEQKLQLMGRLKSQF